MKKQTESSWIKRLFEGRLCRRNYFLGLIASGLLAWLPSFTLYALLKLFSTIFGIDLFGGVAGGLISLLFLVVPWLIYSLFALSLNFRRHSDLNQNGYYLLAAILLIVVFGMINTQLGEIAGGIYALYLFLAVGSNGKNKFGEEDKKRGWKSILGLQK